MEILRNRALEGSWTAVSSYNFNASIERILACVGRKYIEGELKSLRLLSKCAMNIQEQTIRVRSLAPVYWFGIC
jgi:hypothetical protein